MTPEVYILDSAAVPHAEDCAPEAEALEGCALTRLLHLNDETDFEPFLDRAAALIVWHQLDITSRTIRRLRDVRIIVRNGVGFDNVDARAAAESGIPLANVPDYGTEEVADHAMALCLALIRRLRPLIDDIAGGRWRWQAAEQCRRIRGQVFGVVGCGRIGTATALRAQAFGFDVRFYDPYVAAGYEKALGVKRDSSLEALLEKADLVSLHVPLTAETLHLIDVPQLRRMKPGACLVNTARGGVVRHSAVEEALARQWIAGAALDVLEDEPRGMDLAARFPNCIVTPHSAFYSRESVLEMRRSSAGIVRDALLHGRFCNVVNGVHPPKVSMA
jgi:phosphoglycerate dehydrogenase-like enzyme